VETLAHDSEHLVCGSADSDFFARSFSYGVLLTELPTLCLDFCLLGGQH